MGPNSWERKKEKGKATFVHARKKRKERIELGAEIMETKP
jgi:hypothetical protein